MRTPPALCTSTARPGPRAATAVSYTHLAGEGKIKKVAANTYIITPYHVDIMGDLIDELENNGLYL